MLSAVWKSKRRLAKPWMERRSTKGGSEAKAASDQEARKARKAKKHLGQTKRQRAHQERAGNRVAGRLERHQGDDLGGDVHILYDQVRDEETALGGSIEAYKWQIHILALTRGLQAIYVWLCDYFNSKVDA